jgi:predicted nucleic acid-binding protein
VSAAAPKGEPLAVDTNVFSFIHLHKDPWRKWAPLLDGRRLALPFPVVGELRVLAIRSRWGTDRVQALEKHIAQCTVIPSDDRVVHEWARLHAHLLGQLKAGGINDLWSAACCLVHSLPIATADLADFGAIQRAAPSLALVYPL